MHRCLLYLCTLEMLGSCVGVAVLAILFEGVKVLRKYIDVKLKRERQHVLRRADRVRKLGSDNDSKSVSTNCSKEDFPEEHIQHIRAAEAEHRRKQYVGYSVIQDIKWPHMKAYIGKSSV